MILFKLNINQLLYYHMHMGNLWKGFEQKSGEIVEGRYLSFAIFNVNYAIFNLKRFFRLFFFFGFYARLFVLAVFDLYQYEYITTWLAILKYPYRNYCYFINTWISGYFTNFKFVRRYFLWLLECKRIKGGVNKMGKYFKKARKDYPLTTKRNRLPAFIIATQLGINRSMHKESLRLQVPLVSLFDSDIKGGTTADYIIPSNDDSIPFVMLFLTTLFTIYWLGLCQKRIFFKLRIFKYNSIEKIGSLYHDAFKRTISSYKSSKQKWVKRDVVFKMIKIILWQFGIEVLDQLFTKIDSKILKVMRAEIYKKDKYRRIKQKLKGKVSLKSNKWLLNFFINSNYNIERKKEFYNKYNKGKNLVLPNLLKEKRLKTYPLCYSPIYGRIVKKKKNTITKNNKKPKQLNTLLKFILNVDVLIYYFKILLRKRNLKFSSDLESYKQMQPLLKSKTYKGINVPKYLSNEKIFNKVRKSIRKISTRLLFKIPKDKSKLFDKLLKKHLKISKKSGNKLGVYFDLKRQILLQNRLMNKYDQINTLQKNKISWFKFKSKEMPVNVPKIVHWRYFSLLGKVRKFRVLNYELLKIREDKSSDISYGNLRVYRTKAWSRIFRNTSFDNSMLDIK